MCAATNPFRVQRVLVERRRDEVVNVERGGHRGDVAGSHLVIGVNEQKLRCQTACRAPTFARVSRSKPVRSIDDPQSEAAREALGDLSRVVLGAVVDRDDLPATGEVLARECLELVARSCGRHF